MIYNIPVTRGVQLEAETFSKISELDQIVGLKDSTGNLMQFHEYVEKSKGDISLLMGRDGLILQSLELGGDGAVSGLSNFCPNLATSIVSSYKQNNYSTSLKKQRKILEVEDAILSGSSAAAGIKSGVELLDFDCKGPRSPLSEFSKSEKEHLEKVLRKHEIIKSS